HWSAVVSAAPATVSYSYYPANLCPSFTHGGTGGGVAYNRAEFEELVERALELSPVHTTLIERSVLGWKEFELEVMRDHRDNVVIVCSIENVDPMGVHTGDSITVAPAMTLTDREYQRMRDAALAVIREIGVEAGGCNIQFAVNPADGAMLVIEMNPRVSRSSALASKATGCPIARIGAKLAVGYTLDELPHDRLTSDSPEDLRVALRTPTPERVFQIKRALLAGLPVEAIAEATGIDPWFLYQLEELVAAERWFAGVAAVGAAQLRRMKRLGFSDHQLAELRGSSEQAMRQRRWDLDIHPVYKTVDTCAGEFPSSTPYLYSTYDAETESEPFGERGIVILGSGPNRVGQGVEFDYCCVRAGLAFRELGYRTIMINSNP